MNDLAKLPKWAQQHIKRLEHDLERAHAELRVGPEDSDTFADPFIHSRPLGRGPTVRFQLAEHAYVDARANEDSQGRRYVELRGHMSIAIEPFSGNVVRVRADP